VSQSGDLSNTFSRRMRTTKRRRGSQRSFPRQRLHLGRLGAIEESLKWSKANVGLARKTRKKKEQGAS
jgi:hypothetical protein